MFIITKYIKKYNLLKYKNKLKIEYTHDKHV